MDIKDMLTRDSSFRYQMLNRMQSDCEYAISIKYVKALWAKDVDTHIDYMIQLHNSFLPDAKPEWLTIDKIHEYHRKLKSIK